MSLSSGLPHLVPRGHVDCQILQLETAATEALEDARKEVTTSQSTLRGDAIASMNRRPEVEPGCGVRVDDRIWNSGIEHDPESCCPDPGNRDLDVGLPAAPLKRDPSPCRPEFRVPPPPRSRGSGRGDRYAPSPKRDRTSWPRIPRMLPSGTEEPPGDPPRSRRDRPGCAARRPGFRASTPSGPSTFPA